MKELTILRSDPFFYVAFLVGASSYESALADARKARDTEAAAQLEALAETLNPMPISQQDVRDAQEAAGAYWDRRADGVTRARFGDLLD